MQTAFVILYLTYGTATTMEVPERFPSMEACQKSFDGILSKRPNAKSEWETPATGIPLGTCVPIMGTK